jgi:hypothetical protein
VSRAFDFTVVAVVVIVSILVNRMALELLQPGTVLYQVATDGTSNVGGKEFADFVWQAVGIYVPLISSFGIMAWATLREYRRQAVTAAQPV